MLLVSSVRALRALRARTRLHASTERRVRLDKMRMKEREEKQTRKREVRN